MVAAFASTAGGDRLAAGADPHLHRCWVYQHHSHEGAVATLWTGGAGDHGLSSRPDAAPKLAETVAGGAQHRRARSFANARAASLAPRGDEFRTGPVRVDQYGANAVSPGRASGIVLLFGRKPG